MAREAEAPWTIQRLIAWGSQHFQERGIDSPRLTIEELIGHVLSASRVQLYMDLQRPMEKRELDHLRELVKRRDARIPLQHLLGIDEFRGLQFKVDGRALIPRPETELLVEACLERIPLDAATSALELGIGSGVIGLSLLAARPQLRLVAIEVSTDAAVLAHENAVRLEVAERLDLREGDLFGPLQAPERFDLLVSNPPYVATEVIAGLEPEVRDHDPHVALDGGADGLEVIRRIVDKARDWLVPKGLLALEIGDDQGPAVRALFEGAGFSEVEIRKDYSELDRIALGRVEA